jgi:hypothetical protein
MITFIVSFLLILAAPALAPTHIEAQSVTIGTFKIGTVIAANTGELTVVSDQSGISWNISGTAACTGAIQFHVNANGVANPEGTKDRLLNLFMAAQLSGRKVTVAMQRNSNNNCFVNLVFLTNAY